MRIVAGLLVGILIGALAALALSVAAAWIFDISQMEGAYAMGVAFFYMPAGALIGGIAGAIFASTR